MDWSPRETFLAPDGIDEFTCEDVEADSPMTVLYKFNPNHKSNDEEPVQRLCSKPPKPGSSELDFSKPNFWEEFKGLPLFQYDRWIKGSKLPSGLCIFFCPPANPVFDDIPSELSDICIPREEWEDIATRFCLNNLLVKAIRQKITSVSVEHHHLVKGDIYHETGDTLLMCTVTMFSPGSSGSHDFAISSTHFKKANLTLAVVLGATPGQVDKVTALLANADEAIGHPLLMLGLAAELMLDNLVDPVEYMRDECIRNIRRSREMLFVTDRSGTNFAMEVESIRSESQWLDEAVKTTKENLVKGLAVYEHVNGSLDDSEKGMSDNSNKPESGDVEFETKLLRYVNHKMNTRFQDIVAHLDVLIAVTRISVQDMCSMSTTMTGELNRRDAADSAQTAKTGALIAFVAMLYLPITSVATIFATPVFKFENNWLDWRFQPTTSSSPSTDDNSDSNLKPVFSGYFWIYFVVSIALTSLTLEGWWRVAGRKPPEIAALGSLTPHGHTKQHTRPLPHWTLYPFWPYIKQFFPLREARPSDEGSHGRGESGDGTEKARPTSAGGDSRGDSSGSSATPINLGPDGSRDPADGVATSTGALEVKGGGSSNSGTMQQVLFRLTSVTRRGKDPGSPSLSAV